MPRRKLLLAAALLPESHLQGHVEVGLGAVTRAHHNLIAVQERPRIGDSLDLDSATAQELAESNRWDYVLSVPDAFQLVGLEPHSARDSEIGTVIAKKEAAAQYLREHLAPGIHIARWYWVSGGPARFSIMESARRRLDKHGILFRGRMITSLD